MSYNFYSLVSSIKDKSSQAMATLSSDLKEFSTIMQEDVTEVAKSMRKTVQETSEALRQRSATDGGEGAEAKDDADGDAAAAEKGGEATATEESKETEGQRSMFSFGGFSLESVGSKLLNQADQFLGTLAGDEANEDDDAQGDDVASSERRFRLLALQEDTETYVEPPMDIETFQRWRSALTAEEMTALREEVQAHYPVVSTRFAELVPDSVSADDFWAHYIYKASLLAAQEKRGADLLEHALNDSEEEIGWDLESPRNDDGEAKAEAFSEDMTETSEGQEGAAVATEAAPAPSVAAAAAPANAEATSSDGESWIELEDQQRKEQLPPLSTSSTSSFIRASVPSPAGDDDDEDVDWGDDEADATDDVKQAEEELKSSAKSPAPSDDQSVSPPPAPEQPKKQSSGGEWGEWD